MIPVRRSLYNIRTVIYLPVVNTIHSFFESSFFPSTIIEWNKLDINVHYSRSLFIFKKHILQFIRPFSNSVYNPHNRKDIILMTRLRLGLSHLREHTFNTVFKIRLIFYVTVVTMLNQQIISFATVLCSQIKGALSLALYIIYK